MHFLKIKFVKEMIFRGALLLLLREPSASNTGDEKKPISNGWQKSTRNDPRLVLELETQYFNHNVGIRTGTPSGFVIVDIDGEEGWEIYKKVSCNHPVTTVTVSTPSGGLHLYYKIPNEKIKTVYHTKVFSGENSHSECAFLGNGRYAVMPYSLGAKGRYYDFVDGLSPYDIEFEIVPPYIEKIMIGGCI